MAKAVDRFSGVTLVELLLVMILLGVMAALSIPHFSKTYSSLQLQRTAEDMSYVMKYAQMRAITKGHLVRFLLAEDNSKYWIEERAGEQQSSDEQFVHIRGQWGRTFTIPDEIVVEAKNIGKVDFFPSGQIEGVDVDICLREKCIIVSTQKRRGHVEMFSKD